MHSSGFHAEVFGHISRRALEYAGTADSMLPINSSKPDIDGSFTVSTGGLAILLLTFSLFFLLLSALRYTLWGVVNTLTMVEIPHSLIQLETPPKPLDANGQPIDVEASTIKQATITSSIRNTIRHLHQTAGFRARWRGLALFVCYNLVFSVISAVIGGLTFFLPLFLSALLSALVASLVLARWSTAWTHIVISEPSAKPWYRRVPGWKSWKNVWLPIVINSLTERLTYTLPALTLSAFQLIPDTQGKMHGDKSAILIIAQLLAVFAVGLVTYVALDLPSKVALVRVQASMLPEEDESIVPFDRSFGGKVVPAILGGSGAISFADSWRTFDREARLRVLKLVAKVVAIEIGLHLAFGLIFGGELAMFLQKTTEAPTQG